MKERDTNINNTEKLVSGPGNFAADNQPRSLVSDTVRKARLALLSNSEHMAPLISYMETLRMEDRGFVPNFDPLDGGVNSRILFLLEKPGPRASEPPKGSGFISRDNDDPTAEAIFKFMKVAEIPRSSTILWNLIPWWNGKILYRAEERRAGLLRLHELLDLLPELKTVVAVGKQAEYASTHCAKRGLAVFTSMHPSPRNKNLKYSKWRAIPNNWAKAWEHTN